VADRFSFSFKSQWRLTIFPLNVLSNQVDIAYLFYLPFCKKLFVSNDKLSRVLCNSVPAERSGVRVGRELKDDLRKLNQFYDKMPQQTKDQCVMKFCRFIRPK